MSKLISRKIILASACVFAMNVQAQESVTNALDSCINAEKIAFTLKGAAAGAATAFLGSLFIKKEDDNTGRNVAIGAAAGAAIGYATAYYKAAGICMEKNPSWVPESQIERGSNYAAVVKEFNYKKKTDLLKLRSLNIPESVHPGTTPEVSIKFVVLTPDGGEAKVRIKRKLFVAVNGQEQEIPFLGKDEEERVVANGEYEEKFPLPIDKDVPVGAQFRVEYSVSLNDGEPQSQSASVVVK